ncbi:SIR2 family protein [Pseudoxanthomonas mexicana]|uniref:SIR2 family protein n=1 Tax=Pseudoxanthomonas mexicana TaxID=128785 RepID=UPI001FD64A59|nr:SIR2 family protein [Pseudoxanthomonas mexicana]UOV05439.1 SIR2 family protein [Pseudoxanthomonas mexicana]
MPEAITLSDIYDKNLNFLIGSGASVGLFPTLALRLKNSVGEAHTLESLATWLEERNDPRFFWLFMHYYTTCIRPAQLYQPGPDDGPDRKAVLANYETFLGTVLHMLQRRKPLDKRCNVFTTNYDGCFAQATDRILGRATEDFVLNDGARGFRHRYLQARNFNTYLCQTGVFERTQTSVPQVNLIHLHGSIYWRKENTGILVDYLASSADDLIPAECAAELAAFSTTLMDENAGVDDLIAPELSPPVRDTFWAAYRKLPIVNPTKWKFHETVFEEHYYQMLRLLSYELEKPNAVLITFGFSFADEHILNLLRRSLSNPSLQLFVCCYSSSEYTWLSALFKVYSNVKCIALEDGKLDFQAFNDQIFTTSPPADNRPPLAEGVPAAGEGR